MSTRTYSCIACTFLALTLTFVGPSHSTAQTRIDIVLSSGQAWPRVSLLDVTMDSVIVLDAAGETAFGVMDIDEFHHRKGTYMNAVAGAGALVGLGVGVAWYLGEGGNLLHMFDMEDDPYDDYDESNWRVWVPVLGGGLLGAGIGALIPKSEIVRLKGLGVELRIAEFRRLLPR